MDELTILRALGDETPADLPALRAHAHARLTKQTNRDTRRWWQRRTALAFAAVSFAIIAGPALAFRADLIRFLNGSPPSATVLAEAAGLPPGYTASGVHEYVQLTTSIGALVTLWEASGPDGRALGLAWTPAQGGPATTVQGSAISFPQNSPVVHPLLVSQSETRVAGGWINLLFGQTDPDITSLELVSTDGRSEPLPFSDGYYLIEVPSWSTTTDLVAKDASGNEVARRPVDMSQPPTPTGPRQTLLTDQAGDLKWTLYRYPTTDNHQCYGIEATPTATTAGSRDAFQCGVDPPTVANPIISNGPAKWADATGAGQTTSVFGLIAPNITSVQLVYANGSTDTAAIGNGGFADLAPYDPARGLPTRLRAFDTNGNQIVDRPLPT